MTRTSTLIGWVPPTRKNERASSTRSSFTCVAGAISPISSRKMVPVSASSNRPSRRSAAPVKAPFSWPKSSLSSSVSGIAAQLTAMNGLLRRGERSWMRLGDQLLAGARLALDQHRARDRRHLLDPDQHLLDAAALADDAGALLEAAAAEQAARGGGDLVGVDRLDQHLGDAEAADALAPLRIGGLEQREGGDLRVPRERGELEVGGLVHRAGEHHEIGVLPPHRAAGVVERAEHRGGQAGGLERGVGAHRGLEVVHGDQDLRGHRISVPSALRARDPRRGR